MTSDDFKQDEQLKRLLNRVHQDVEIPDGQQSWLQVKVRLNKAGKRKRWISRLKITALASCIILMISYAMTADLPKACIFFLNLIKKMQGNIDML